MSDNEKQEVEPKYPHNKNISINIPDMFLSNKQIKKLDLNLPQNQKNDLKELHAETVRLIMENPTIRKIVEHNLRIELKTQSLYLTYEERRGIKKDVKNIQEIIELITSISDWFRFVIFYGILTNNDRIVNIVDNLIEFKIQENSKRTISKNDNKNP